MAEFTSNYNLYKWNIRDYKRLTIDEMAKNADKIDQALTNSGGTLVFNTLAELQSAYPNGTLQPAWVRSEKSWYYWDGVILGDTLPPVVTVSPSAGTFSTAQSVTLSANETATIYYTLDGSTPSTASTVYSAPINIPVTTTLKYFARDSDGNASAVQTAVYTISVAPSYLQLNGTTDYLTTPSVTVNRILMEMNLDTAQPSSTFYYFVDYRPTNTAWAYGQINAPTAGWGGQATNLSNVIINGTTFAGVTTFDVPRGSNVTFEINTTVAFTGALQFFRKNDNTFYTKAKAYRLRGYNGGTLVFDYDMSQGNLQDVSGNGNHGTLFGGTWN